MASTPSTEDLWAFVRRQQEEIAQLRKEHQAEIRLLREQITEQRAQSQDQQREKALLASRLQELEGPAASPRKRGISRAGLIKAAAAGAIGLAGAEVLRPQAALADPNDGELQIGIVNTTGTNNNPNDSTVLVAGSGFPTAAGVFGADATNSGADVDGLQGRGSGTYSGVAGWGGTNNGAGVIGFAGSTSGSGVVGKQGDPPFPAGKSAGVLGGSDQSSGTGVYGFSSGAGGTGIYALATGNGGSGVVGVQGSPHFSSGDNAGVMGGSDSGIGVYGFSSATGGLGLAGYCPNGDGIGVSGYSPNIRGIGVQGVGGGDATTSVGVAGWWGGHTVAPLQHAAGVFGSSPGSAVSAVLGLQGDYSQTLPSGATAGVFGATDQTNGYGMYAYAPNGVGLYCESTTGFGVHAIGFPGFLAEGATYSGAHGRGGRFISQQAQIRLNPATASAPPSTGQAAGDFFVASDGGLWYCKNGTTWHQIV